MYSYDEACEVLGDLIDELPDEIFRDLNGGVMLMEDAVRAEDETVILGTYFRDTLGRHVELYYGSFTELYGDMEDEAFREKLRKTLHHELTHHVESMAGDRSLERWDERQAELYGFNGIDVHSILFVDADCSSFAPAAAAVFDAEKQGKAAEVKVLAASAGACAEEFNPKALKLCDSMGINVSSVSTACVSRELMEEYDVALCMTASQAELLSEKYQDLDDKIMCLAEDDIEPPLMAMGWKKCLQRLKDEVLAVIDELNLED